MTWNYRIFRKTYPNKILNSHMEETVYQFEIREAYYYGKNGKNSKKVNGWTQEAAVPNGDTPDELIEVLEMMLSDAKRSRDDVLDAITGKSIVVKKEKKR